MDSKTQHTAGPWWVAATGEADDIGFAIGAENCVIGYMAERADAMLAKAAPEMLGALTCSTGVLEACLPLLSGERLRMTEMQIAANRAAIARAEGR